MPTSTAPNTTAFESERFIRAQELRTRYSISAPTLHRWVKSGKIPPPQYLNNIRVWRQSIIEAAEEQMLASDDRMKNRLEPRDG